MLGHFCAFPTFISTLRPNKVSFLPLKFPLCIFEWAEPDRELLKHFEKCSEHIGTSPNGFARAGQREAALWPAASVLGGASSLSGARHAA